MTEELKTLPPLKIVGEAEIKHLNVRKQGPDDDRVIAVDLKIQVKGVDHKICDCFDDALSLFLWRHETSGLIARNLYLGPVRYGNHIENATVNIAHLRFAATDVKKFEIEPRDGGHVVLTCSVTITDPRSDEVSDLARMVQEVVDVKIEQQPGLFDAPAQQQSSAKKTRSEDTTQALPWLDDSSSKAKDDDSADAKNSGSSADDEAVYLQALQLVRNSGRASMSLVQRTLSIGCTRAGRMLDRMEREGIVSAKDALGARTLIGASHA